MRVVRVLGLIPSSPVGYRRSHQLAAVRGPAGRSSPDFNAGVLCNSRWIRTYTDWIRGAHQHKRTRDTKMATH